MDLFEEAAQHLSIHHIRWAWLQMAKVYNEMSEHYGGTLSMSFVILAIDEDGTPVTKIAPRMGMEPNSLSRILKSLEHKGVIYRKGDKKDQRKVFVYLTELGKKYREIALKAVFRLENEIRKDIPDEKLQVFFEVIQKVPQAIMEFKEKVDSGELKFDEVDPKMEKKRKREK